MSTTHNVAAKIAALLDRVDKLTTTDNGKATTFNFANQRRAEAIAAEEAAADRR